MYEIIKNVIEAGNYELVDMLKKINTVWIESNITDEQKQELDELARANARAENSYEPLQEQVNDLYSKYDELKQEIAELKGEDTEEPTEPEPVDEYPEFVQPTGAHDAYNIGMGCTFNGEKYICLINGCVWDPITYPAGWQKVTETAESEVSK